MIIFHPSNTHPIAYIFSLYCFLRRVEGVPPTPRQGHTATLISSDKMVIFGGWGSGGCQTQDSVNDPKAFSIHVLDTTSMTWWCPRKTGKKPLRHVYQHGAVALDDTLVIFGGFDGRQAGNAVSTINCDFGFQPPMNGN